MSLSVGPVEAWADVVLDVYVNFKPFYFIGVRQACRGKELANATEAYLVVSRMFIQY